MLSWIVCTLENLTQHFSTEEEADLLIAEEWYEEQRAGLCKEFHSDVLVAIDRILINTLIYRVSPNFAISSLLMNNSRHDHLKHSGVLNSRYAERFNS